MVKIYFFGHEKVFHSDKKLWYEFCTRACSSRDLPEVSQLPQRKNDATIDFFVKK